MSRYNATYPHASSAKSLSFDSSAAIKIERHDDHASQSGSEDGSYAHFGADPLKLDGELEEDSNTALTSQTLNADGTPKRPMNAFMIFARRRRPQVSAENQAMRTGEISKILSKEWVSMPPSEKQFYLEQAKQLKETFNTRYPDYVYRRRPNNSRKRRRSDAGARQGDQASFDHDGDATGSVDLEASPTDGDEHHIEIPVESPYSRSSFIPPSSLDQPKYNTLTRPVHPPVSSEPVFRSNGDYTTSLPERLGPLGPATSPRLPMGHNSGMPYSLYNTQPVPSPQGWQSRVDRTNPSWLGGSQDRIPSAIATQKPNPYNNNSGHSWHNSPENNVGPPSASPTSSNFFPTLNTPFYPSQPHVPPFQSNSSTSSSLPPQNSGPYDGPLGQLQTGPLSRDYPQRSYEPLSPMNAYPTTSPRDPYSRSSTGSGYPPPPSSGHGHPPTYWPRD